MHTFSLLSTMDTNFFFFFQKSAMGKDKTHVNVVGRYTCALVSGV